MANVYSESRGASDDRIWGPYWQLFCSHPARKIRRNSNKDTHMYNSHRYGRDLHCSDARTLNYKDIGNAEWDYAIASKNIYDELENEEETGQGRESCETDNTGWGRTETNISNKLPDTSTDQQTTNTTKFDIYITVEYTKGYKDGKRDRPWTRSLIPY
jgi:hypothetical protein